MARFVEFSKAGSGRPVWVNVDRIDGVQEDSTDTKLTMISCSGPDNVWWVTETVAEVLAKLQGDPQPEPAKAGDNIAGWWIGPSGTVYYVIGRDYWGRWVYQVDGHHILNTLTMSRMAEWTRDPNRKGWDR